MSANTKHLGYLDGWRGLAIISVLLAHYTHLPVLNTGRFGVELFFVLSGRLMAEILFVRNVALPDFFRRRIARVWPALVVFILIMTVIFSAAGPLHVSGLNALTALTFTANYLNGSEATRCVILDHIWSLCVEEHTYVFLAVIALLVRKRLGNAIVLCLVASALCILSGAFQTLVLHRDYYAVYWRTDARASSILLATACHLALRESTRFSLLFNPYSCLIFGAAGFLLSTTHVPDVVKYSFGTGALALAVCLLDRANRRVLAALGHPVLVQFGLVSFSLYLWQQPFVYTLHLSHPWLAPLAIIPCALASFYLIEQPARQFLNTHWVKKSGQIARPSAVRLDRAAS